MSRINTFATTTGAPRGGRSWFTCSFLADVGQVVVAGNVVPLAFLVSDGHGAVLPACKEVIWLVLPPILINLHDRKPAQGLLFPPPVYFVCITLGISRLSAERNTEHPSRQLVEPFRIKVQGNKKGLKFLTIPFSLN